MRYIREMFVVGGVIAACGAMTPSCWVCNELGCSDCVAGDIMSCELPTRAAGHGESGRERLVYPPKLLYCSSWDGVGAGDVVDGPCDPAPAGYTLIGSTCSAGKLLLSERQRPRGT